jgi:pyruvate dehydrogenase E2 component (dihydrolipoamide acetyltransferase)
MKADIRRAAEAKEKGADEKTPQHAAVKDEVIDERRPMSMLRKTVARTMVRSKQEIPHAAAMDEFDVTDLVAFKKDYQAFAEASGVHLTYLPLILRGLTLALREHPLLNASIDASEETILLKKKYNIGLAVDTPDGLVVPVIHHAEDLGVLGLAREVRRLSEAAREKKLKLEDLQDGTISVTNYGAIGARFGVPVIKPPEVAILGIGRIEKQAVVRDDEIVIRSILPISLAFDHRVLDGGDAGRFLQTLKGYLEAPEKMLLY